jgi:uncharacterized protein YndB with AHSA1/START domain
MKWLCNSKIFFTVPGPAFNKFDVNLKFLLISINNSINIEAMQQDTFNWSRFSLRISIKASLNTLYSYWTRQENIERFFLEKALFTTSGNHARAGNTTIEKDDSYEWKWYGSDIIAKGRIIATNGKDMLQFSFFDCKVTVKIFVIEGENMVELTQEEIPTDEASIVNLHLGCTRGWTFYLTNLKSILEGGIDLRNRNVLLGDVINT